MQDGGDRLNVGLSSNDGSTRVNATFSPTRDLPAGSVFDSIEHVSQFFEQGSLGYPDQHAGERYDGLELRTDNWSVTPVYVENVASSFFDSPTLFPDGSAVLADVGSGRLRRRRTRGSSPMQYEFTNGPAITEEEALARATAMGLHAYAIDDAHEVDEELHWHEFDAATWVISGTGSFAVESGEVTDVGPGCHVTAPAGWLHRSLAGTTTRIVVGTSVAAEAMTQPINKAPADRPAELAV